MSIIYLLLSFSEHDKGSTMTEIEPLSRDIGFLLTRASALLLDCAKRSLAPFDLRVRPYSVLVLACEHEQGINQRQVAENLGLDPSQVVAFIDELEKRQLIIRAIDTNDRRNKMIAVTDGGRQLCSEAQKSLDTAQTELLAQLPTESVDHLRDTLAGLVFPPTT